MSTARTDASATGGMACRVGSQQGLGAIVVFVALMVVALLYFGYFRMQSAMQSPKQAATTIDTSKDFACKTNRQTVEGEVQAWMINHPGETPSLAALVAEGGATAHCPQGGEYSLDGVRVHCSRHD